MLMFMLMSFPVVLSMGMLMHAEFTCFMLVIMNSGTSFVAVGVVMLMTVGMLMLMVMHMAVNHVAMCMLVLVLVLMRVSMFM